MRSSRLRVTPRSFLLAAGLAVLLAGAREASPAEKFWINPAGGRWSVGSNWADGVPPSLVVPDNVTIEHPGWYLVDVDTPGLLFERLSLGGPFGEQTLDIHNLTARASGPIHVHPTGVVRTRNVTLVSSGSTIQNQGGWRGLEFNAVSSGGFINLRNVTIERGTTSFQGLFQNAPGSLLEVDGILRNTTARFDQIVNGGRIHLMGSELAELNVTGALNVEPDGVIEARPGGLRSLFAPLFNYGRILVNATTSIGRPDAPVLNAGVLSAILDNVTIEGSAFIFQGTLNVGPLRNVTLRARSWTDAPGAVLRGAGVVYDASEVIHNLTCRIVPGGEAGAGGTAGFGVLTLVADPTLAAPSRIQVDLGGLGAGVGHDQVRVRDVDLDGALDVALVPGYRPSVGDEFEVLAWSGRTGRFRAITGLDLGGGLYLQPVYTPTSLKLVTTTSPPVIDKVWINPDGGLWSDGANWGDGVAPSNTKLENVTIEYRGSYLVDVDPRNVTFGGLLLGGPSGRQTLRKTHGNVTFWDDLDIRRRGSLILDNVTLEAASPSPSDPPPSVVNDGNVLIRNTTRIASEFRNLHNATIEDAELDWLGTFENLHNVTVQGGSSRFHGLFRNLRNVTFDRSSTVFGGPFVNEAGADLRASSACCRNVSIRFDGPVTSSGRIQMGGIPADKRRNNVTFESSQPFVIETGGLLTTEGTGIRSLFGPLVNRGALLLNATFQLIAPGTLHLNLGSIVLERGNVTVAGALDNRGSLQIGAGQVIRVEMGYRDRPGGVLKGSGTLQVPGTANVTGRIQPGVSPGILQVDGSLGLATTSRVEIELGGPAAGAQHDRLAVSGHAALHGTLAVELIDGFVPQMGDSFVVMTYGSHSGNFIRFEGTTLPNGLFLTVDQRSGSLVLRASQTNAASARVPREIEFRARSARQSVWFELGLPRAAETRIDVFDVTGRTVGAIRDERREAGLHTVRWNASGLPSGAYFVRLRVREPGQAADRRTRFIWLK